MFSTSINKLFLSITLVVLMLFPLACSEKNSDAPDYNKVHTEDWYNPQYLSNTVFHGTEVKRQGTSACSKCHEIYSEGQENIPGCFKCHFGPDGSREPVSADWAHGLERHEAFPDDQAVCNSCHEVGRSFGTGPGICHNCHGSGEEHILGQPWLDPKSAQFHGPLPQDECANCHNMSLDCNKCHFGPTGSKAPIGSGWLHGNNDGHKDFENKNATCGQCHTLNRSYDNGPGICHDCHGSGETHVLGQPWLDSASFDYHGNQLQDDCANCHTLSTDCYQCHFGPTGSKSPIGSGWLHRPDDEDHKDRDFEAYINICNSCHFLSRSYRGEPDSSCHDCHDD